MQGQQRVVAHGSAATLPHSSEELRATESREGKKEDRGGLLLQGNFWDLWTATRARRRLFSLPRVGEIRQEGSKLGHVPNCGCRGEAYRGNVHDWASMSAAERTWVNGEWRHFFPGVRSALG
jgi:hypothetical protein